MEVFLSGAVAMASLVAALYFARFFRETRDRLFLFFGLAFLILSFQRVLVALLHRPAEEQPLLYGFRLLAFILILIAIIDKNRGGSSGEE
jgi:hypothetical protein